MCGPELVAPSENNRWPHSDHRAGASAKPHECAKDGAALQISLHLMREQDLIRRLLTVDPRQRLTASKAVNHPWLLSKDNDLLNNNLKVNLEQLRLFNARRKLRAAIKSVRQRHNSIALRSRVGWTVHWGPDRQGDRAACTVLFVD